MKESIELLNFVYQNAKMGIVGINQISDKIEEVGFKEVIGEQLADYEVICSEAIELFIKYGKNEKDIGIMVKVMSYMYSFTKTLTDHSTSNLAKLMIDGSNKGVIEITEKLNNMKNVDKEVYKLGEKLLKIEEKNIETLKRFL